MRAYGVRLRTPEGETMTSFLLSADIPYADIAFFVVVALGLILGVIRGFSKSFKGVFLTIAIMLSALLLITPTFDSVRNLDMFKNMESSITEKIEKVVRKVYGGDGVSIAPAAQKQIANLEKLGFSNLPVCIAKTQYSFSDDATLLGAPSGFTVTVKNVKVSAGAGFIVVLTGEIMTMPGLPKSPAAERIDVTDDGKITGLF